jgi:hypothetical protein
MNEEITPIALESLQIDNAEKLELLNNQKFTLFE